MVFHFDMHTDYVPIKTDFLRLMASTSTIRAADRNFARVCIDQADHLELNTILLQQQQKTRIDRIWFYISGLSVNVSSER